MFSWVWGLSPPIPYVEPPLVFRFSLVWPLSIYASHNACIGRPWTRSTIIVRKERKFNAYKFVMCDLDALLSNPHATKIFKMTTSERSRSGTDLPISFNNVSTTTETSQTTATHSPDQTESEINDVLYTRLYCISLNLISADLIYSITVQSASNYSNRNRLLPFFCILQLDATHTD